MRARSRQRLILEEEDDLPLEDPAPQRAPYVSPELVAVTMPPAAGSSSDGGLTPQAAVVETPIPVPSLAGTSKTEASEAVAPDVLPDEMAAGADLVLDDIMARVCDYPPTLLIAPPSRCAPCSRRGMSRYAGRSS